MELTKDTYNNLVSLIDNAKQNTHYELEARFWAKNLNINEDNYTKLFQKLTFTNSYNGMGYKYEMKNILDIIIDKNENNIRMSILEESNIKKYWLLSKTEGLNPVYIEKEKLDKVDDENYNIRFSLNNELPKNDILKKNIDILTNNTTEKTYRLKNRYTIYTNDGLFVIEMSKIKTGHGNTFKTSNTLKGKISYEIEIEYIGKDTSISSKEIADKLLQHCFMILKILHNTNYIIPNTLKDDLKTYYKDLINTKMDDFIAASPVTIHQENLFRSEEIANIYQRYAVTLKADGQRVFLIVYKTGKIYIFNNNYQFIDTGYEDTNWIGTLLEGEYIDENNELYLYDALYSKNNDIRKKHLIDINTENITRINIIEQFIKSTTRKRSNNFIDELCTKIKLKKYIQTVRNDGSDIFQKVKELWDTRQYNTFGVDGIIFVPKYLYYPLRGGTWDKLFKWKPPHLNSIDFLSQTVKDDNDNDVRSPYIEVIKRIDGKTENILKQYVTFKLYVTGQKTIYNRNNNRKIKVPIPFNPFGLDEKNSEKFNIAKVFVDDDNKIYATDPITNEKIEITDDIIIEWSYDNSKEDGFKWIPMRYRRDKTTQYKNGEKMFGNAERTANDIFKSFQMPITEEMITTGNIPVITEDKNGVIDNPYYVRQTDDNGKRKRYPYQNFHNLYVKFQLLYLSSPTYIKEINTGYEGKILDLCCGRGVDYNKIKSARYAELIGMDIDFENIKIAQEIFKARAVPPPKAYYVRGDTSKLIFPNQATAYTEADKIKTQKFIPTKYMFDTISLQFCFHYFFKSEITFRTILQNLNDNLKIGGFVIGTTFDGERIYNALNKTTSVCGKEFSGDLMWKIEKKYKNKTLSFTEKTPNFGKQIDVLVKTIGVVHPEYLVNFKYMVRLMKEYGFSMVFIKPFEELHKEIMDNVNIMKQSESELNKYKEFASEMSDAEKTFSFFSSAFMFKKEHNSSDTLLKKLMELMEKESKVKIKMESNAYIVDKDTEEFIQDIKEQEE